MIHPKVPQKFAVPKWSPYPTMSPVLIKKFLEAGNRLINEIEVPAKRTIH
jgi:hypothetical protein